MRMLITRMFSGETDFLCKSTIKKRKRGTKMKRIMASTMAFLMLLTSIMSVVPATAGALELDGTVGDLSASVEDTSTFTPLADPDLSSPGALEANGVGALQGVAVAGISSTAGIVAAEASADLEVGKTYLIDVSALNTSQNGPSTFAPMYYDKAVVSIGADNNSVTFFHSNSPTISGQSATPEAVYGYKYDSTQSGANLSSADPSWAAADKEKVDDSVPVRGITVSWPNLDETLLVGVFGNVPGMPAMAMPAKSFLALDVSTATLMTANPFPSLDDAEDLPIVVDKSALKVLIDQAAAVKEADYTLVSYAALASALEDANTIYADADATQTQVDSACAALQKAYGELQPIPGVDMEVGKTYLVDIYPGLSDGSGAVSPLLAGLYYSQAEVEVKDTGCTVTFYHYYSPEVMPDVVASPESVYGYKYDFTQSQTAATASSNLVSATREDLSIDKSVRRITVQWPDASKPLYVAIGSVPGMPAMLLPAPTFMVLKPQTAQLMITQPFPDADFEEAPAQPADKSALSALITQAEQLKQTDYTQESFTTLTVALSDARAVYADEEAIQLQIDTACNALQSAINALQPIPGVDMEVGKTYLVDIYPGLSDGSGTVSPLLAGLYYAKAIVEVREGGNIVIFFHSKSPVVDSPGGQFLAPPDSVYGYKYDTSQSSDRAAAELSMANVPIEELNADKSVKRIVVPWPDTSKPLYMTIGYVPGMPASVLPAPTFMILKLATAQVMATNPFPEFEDSGEVDVKPQEVNKASLQTLINSAAAVDSSKYTQASYANLSTALKNARAVLADQKATQAQVNVALVALQVAIDGLVLAPTKMADGRYTVRVDFWHETLDKPSMANDALNKTAIIDVKNGNMTMSLSTSPIRVSDTVTALGTLVVNGSNARVIARNITIDGASKASAFSFPLPNKSTYFPVVFWLDPQIAQTPRPDLPGRLRISWDTLSANANAGLSTNTAVTTVDKANLDEIARTAETTTTAAPEPVLGASPNGGSVASKGLGSTVKQVAGKLPWYAWTVIGIGVVGIGSGAVVLIRKKARLKGRETNENGSV